MHRFFNVYTYDTPIRFRFIPWSGAYISAQLIWIFVGTIQINFVFFFHILIQTFTPVLWSFVTYSSDLHQTWYSGSSTLLSFFWVIWPSVLHSFVLIVDEWHANVTRFAKEVWSYMHTVSSFTFHRHLTDTTID